MGEPVQFVIDPMRVRDIPDVMRIEKASFTTPWSRAAFLSELLENDRAYYMVAKVDRRAVAYIGVWLIAGEGHITNVAVHPDHRRRGIGRKLMQTIEQLVRSRGGDRLTLEVRKSNSWAQHLYQSLGYRAAGLRKGYYRDNNEDAIIMWKELKPLVAPADPDSGPGFLS